MAIPASHLPNMPVLYPAAAIFVAMPFVETEKSKAQHNHDGVQSTRDLSKSTNAECQMHRCTNAPRHRCTDAQMHKRTNAQTHKCTNAQMHKSQMPNAESRGHNRFESNFQKRTSHVSGNGGKARHGILGVGHIGGEVQVVHVVGVATRLQCGPCG